MKESLLWGHKDDHYIIHSDGNLIIDVSMFDIEEVKDLMAYLKIIIDLEGG